MMSILLPLYVYPSTGAWDPLYAAAKAHPDVDFRVVINPCSGPCVGTLPDQYYLNEIPKLSSYKNIYPLGYVATNYSTKVIDEVLAEIDIYSRWPTMTNNTKFKVDGIFFDETPSTYDPVKYDYLKAASEWVKNHTAFREHYIVHNPGNISSLLSDRTTVQNSYANLSDITVVYEESFNNYLDKHTFQALRTSKLSRSKSAVILHTLPTLTRSMLDFVVEQVQDTADWLFLTSVSDRDQYYHSFSGIFEDFVGVVDQGGGRDWDDKKRSN